MTRDYARTRRQPKKKPPLPGWLWMVTGLLVGLFVAFLVYINRADIPPPQAAATPPVQPAPKPKPAPRTAPKPPAEPEDERRVRFDFYNILPEYEVVIPEEDMEPPKLEQAPPGKYVVQAGSFRSAADADRRKAELALLGLVSRIQRVTVDGSDTWHRVQLGPYEDLKQLDGIRRRLQDNGIEFLLLKQTG